MVIVSHYQLNTEGIAWDVAHVYEHALIHGARKYLRLHGINLDLCGWIVGETFEKYLFIDGGFYDTEVAELFDAYMQDVTNLMLEDVTTAISTVQAEERSMFAGDAQSVFSVCTKLRKSGWSDENSLDTMPIESTQQLFSKCAHKFRTITVAVGAKKLDAADQKVFLRLKPILLDIVYSYLSQRTTPYEVGVSDLTSRQEAQAIGFFAMYTIPRQRLQLTELTQHAVRHIASYPVKQYEKELLLYFDGFAYEQLWKKFSVEYYRETGIATTPEEIRSLASIERIATIFSRIEVEIHDTMAHEREQI